MNERTNDAKFEIIRHFIIYLRKLRWYCIFGVYIYIFTARRSYASAVLGVVILAVRPSVCHTRAL